MMTAVVLNLLVAALAGIAVPLALPPAGAGPGPRYQRVVTFVTDGMGFLLFLGLAKLVLP